MKIIFLDFDGVMDTAYYDHVLAKEGKPGNDKYGTIFDLYCVQNLKRIIDETGAKIVVSSSWKYDMSYGGVKGQRVTSTVKQQEQLVPFIERGWLMSDG